jgi:hypothetical protein
LNTGFRFSTNAPRPLGGVLGVRGHDGGDGLVVEHLLERRGQRLVDAAARDVDGDARPAASFFGVLHRGIERPAVLDQLVDEARGVRLLRVQDAAGLHHHERRGEARDARQEPRDAAVRG